MKFLKKYLKNIISALAAAVLASAGGVCALAGADMPEIPYGEVVIDGVKDECYNDCEELSTDVLVTGYTNYDGSRAKIWLTWDYNGLNVYAEVFEKNPSVNAPNDYERDGVEVFTDEDNSKSEITDANDAQYRVTMDGSNNAGLSGKYGFKYSVITGEPDENGAVTYSVEMQLPWLEIVPFDGKIIGFDAAVNDANSDDKRDSVRQWASDTRANYKDTSRYGEIKLVFGNRYKKWDGKTQLKVAVDGYEIKCAEGELVIVNDFTLVPMRSIFEKLGAEIAWDGKNRTVYAIGNGRFVKIQIDSDTAYVDDEPRKLDANASIINDKTLVPLRFVADCFGAETVYDDYQGLIKITSGK